MQAFTSLFQNSLFSVITNVVNRIGNAVIFIFIVQALGVDHAGVYSLGISYFLIVSRFSFWGLDHLLTREVAKSRVDASKYLSNFFAVRLLLATVFIGIFLAFLQLINYPAETKWVIVLMLLSVWPESVNNLCWAGFATFEEFHFTSISVFFGSLVQIILGLLLLHWGYGVKAMAFIFFFNNLIAMLVNLRILSSRYIERWQRPEWAFVKGQLRIAVPFLFIGVFFILNNQLNTIVLSFLSTEEMIGIYSAATAVILALSMIPQGYRIAVLPVLSRYKEETGSTSVQQLYERSFKYLAMIAIPLGIATILLAEDLIRLIYRRDLPEAVPALQIMAVALSLTFINVLNARLLIVYNQQSKTAHFLVVTTFLNLTINLMLVSQLGAVGASIGQVSSVFVLFILNMIAVRAYMPGINRWPYLWRIMLASLIMGIVIRQVMPWGLGVQILAGGIVYVMILWFIGSFSKDEKLALQSIIKQKMLTKSS